MPDPFAFPCMLRVRQRFPLSQPIDLAAVVSAGLRQRKLLDSAPPGAKIAVGIGSRGIANIAGIATAVVDALRAAGLDPFIVPAMGSHGGATPEGQRTILADYGITESTIGARIDASMAVTRLGQTTDGIDVWTGRAAFEADGIVLVNRVKPHTDFSGDLGSGLVKMSVVGLGKRQGAVTFHAAAARFGHLTALHSMASITLRRLPILAGVAVLEGFRHETARIEVLAPDDILTAEPALVIEAGRMLPRLPFDDIDLLIVDRIGKDISGTGMDANVTGRYVHGYLSSLRSTPDPSGPAIRRILVRNLTHETRGNAIGIGLADFTTSRLVRAIDLDATYTNAITALSLQAAKIPIHFESDREVLAHALRSLGLSDPTRARVVRIVDTLSLVEVHASETFQAQAQERHDLEVLGPAEPMTFDNDGNLEDIPIP